MIEVQRFEKAELFIEALKGKHFDNFFKSFIFRGQSNSEWEILPSAFRKRNKLFFQLSGHSSGSLRNRNNRTQIDCEFYIIKNFCAEIDKNGLHIPYDILINIENSMYQFMEFLNKIGEARLIWPTPEYHSIIALAQHFGVPTRFTDWSYSPYIASYFAAKDNLQKKGKQKGDYIAVYAVNSRNIGLRYGFNEQNKEVLKTISGKNNKKFYQLINTPSYFNTNLKAQKGVFLAYIEIDFNPNDIFQPISFEQFVKKSTSLELFKYELNNKECLNLLKLLSFEFVTASTVFPSIEGCIEALKEKSLLFPSF